MATEVTGGRGSGENRKVGNMLEESSQKGMKVRVSR